MSASIAPEGSLEVAPSTGPGILVLATEFAATTPGRFPDATGGVGVFAYELTRHLARIDPKTVAVVPGGRRKPPEAIKAFGFRVVRAPMYRDDVKKPLWYAVYPLMFASHLAASFALARQLPKAPLLAVRWFPDGYIANLIGRLQRRDYVVVVHGLEVLSAMRQRGKAKRLMSVLRRARKVICVSRYTADAVAGIGIPLSQLVTIPNGVDADVFAPSPDEGAALRKQLGIGECPVLFTMGRLVKRKGHELVMKSLPGLIREFSGLTYLIGGDGPELGSLRQLSRELRIEDSVRFLGRVPPRDLRALYNACDIFVMPNRSGDSPDDIEGFGIVFLEAAACGKPVIGGLSGGAPDAMEDGATGFLIPENHINMPHHLLSQLLRSPELRAVMGARGRQRVLEGFTWDRIASLYARELGWGRPRSPCVQ